MSRPLRVIGIGNTGAEVLQQLAVPDAVLVADEAMTLERSRATIKLLAGQIHQSRRFFEGRRSVLLVLDEEHAKLAAEVAVLARSEQSQVIAFVQTNCQDSSRLEPLVAVAQVVFEAPEDGAAQESLVQAVRGLVSAATEMNLDLRQVVKQRGRGRIALGVGEGETGASTAARRAVALLAGAAVREFRRLTLVSWRGLDRSIDDVAEAAAIIQEHVPKAELQLVGLLDGADAGMELMVYCGQSGT